MKKIILFILLSVLTISATAAVMLAAATEDCPRLSQATDALRWIRDTQEENPSTVAECLTRRIKEVRADQPGAENWRLFLWESADFLRKMVLQAPAGSSARKIFVATELQARVTYREITTALLSVAPAGGRTKLAEEYAKGVNAETNAIWLQAEMTDRGLLDLHNMLMELDPLYMLDQTAVRWLEATRSCPNWTSVVQKALPDYKQAWCPADCAAQYGAATEKLKEWFKTKNGAGTLASYKKVGNMNAEVKKFCGD